jgi:plastocyanin
VNPVGRPYVSTAMHARTSTRPLAALAAIVLFVVTLAACGDDSKDDSSATTAKSSDAEATVVAKGTAFTTDAVTVKAGEDVYLDNQDSFDHTLTADDGSFDTGHVAGGETKEFEAPDKAGTYAFHCSIHSSMTGTLTVQ